MTEKAKVYATVHYESGATTNIKDETVAATLRAWLLNDIKGWFRLGAKENAKEFINLDRVAFVKFHY